MAGLAMRWRVSSTNQGERVLVANTYEAAMTTHRAAINRTNDVAITTRHLLWKKGASDKSVALATADAPALGTIDNVESETGKNQSVLLLGKGPTKIFVASEAIGAGVDLFQAAGGKVTDTPGQYFVGTSITAAGEDGDLIEANDTAATDVSGT